MRLTEQIKTEVLGVYGTWLESYLSGDVETYDSYLDDACRFIGSTNNEEFLSREEATEFFRVTADQFAGKMQLKNQTKTVEAIGELIFLTHSFDAWFPVEEDWSFYGRFRCTSVLRTTDKGWRFIYQHFSTPDSKAQEGETIGYDQISAENLQLREGIKRRTVELEEKNRELAIEAALQRIRAQVTAMQESADLLDIVVTMRGEFVKLGHEAHYFWHMRWLPETYQKAMTSGDGTRIGMVMELPRHIHGNIPLLAAWEKGDDPAVVYPMDVDAALDYVHKMVSLGDFEGIDPQAPGDDHIRHLGGLTFVMARTTHGEIGFSLPGVVPSPPKVAMETLVRFAGVFDLAYRRFEDLKKAEAQAREAEIELALERVRARTMAMHRSDELKEVIGLVYRQLVHLSLPAEHAGFILDYRERDDMHIWLADQNAVFPEIKLPYFDCAHWNSFREAKKTGAQFFANRLDFEEKNRFYKDLFQCIPEIPEAAKAHYFACPGLAISTVLLDNIGLYMENFTGTPFTDQENAILMRFGTVFQQAYTRFLDLQKSEAQAREAEIQLALERVRAATMAMHHSGEFSEVLTTLFEQFYTLGINPSHAVLTVIDKEKNTLSFRMTGTDGRYVAAAQEVDLTVTDAWVDTHEKWKKSDPNAVNVNEYPPAVLPKVWEVYADILAATPEKARPRLENFPNGLFITEGYCRFGYIGYAHNRKPTEEEKDIVRRMAVEFGTLYQRFLDLQKAEAQALEARIEAALEKVRSRTMAMQHSDELPEAANVLFLEVQALGIPAWSCGYNVVAPDKKTAQAWMSSEGTIQKPFTLRLQGEDSFDAWEDFIDGPQTFLVQELGGKALESHYAFMKSFPDLKPIFSDIEAAGLSLPTYQINHLCKFSHGFLLFITYEKVPDAHEIFRRFTAVFEQTYTRFLDLKKAEAQAREARIETALERVRARALAMQEPEELKEVARVMRLEMGLLGVGELETSSIYINDRETGKAECWYAIKDLREKEKGMVADHFALDMNETWVGREMLNFYQAPEDQVSIAMKGEHRREWIAYCEAQSQPLKGYYGEVVPERTYHLHKFSHGAIGVATEGNLSDESWGLLRRAASAFSLAYSRFRDLTQARIDLQKLKEEKKRAEDALKELQLTQQQLVHAEKMASLGELTAGIAHEIQNPLNFVNNFSEVSNELLEEMAEELEKGDLSEVRAIVEDLKQNLDKINHHGKRADGIVKGMLQHSRSSDGKKQPTDLNALAEEYLRLAYHGLRAKDKTFNATLETAFDQTVGTLTLVPQDIGRVLLNLLTNAFHAVSERGQKEAGPYAPTVWVRTSRSAGGVELSVRDNGGGIPEAIREKIFQPFFTTKPTGQGTGLGLSMSYDIVTKGHGGRLRVDSTEGEGTTFTLALPDTNKE